MTRDDDRMAVYSSNGPTWYDGLVKPDVVAPGHFLASEAAPNSSLFKTYPTLRKKGKSGKDFMQLSGTSMSAGVVSGVVARAEAGERRPHAEPREGGAAVHRDPDARTKAARCTARCARAPAK